MMAKWNLSQECKVGLMFEKSSVIHHISQYKEQNKNISYDDVHECRKTSDKFNAHLMIQSFSKLGLENSLNPTKGIYKKIYS